VEDHPCLLEVQVISGFPKEYTAYVDLLVREAKVFVLVYSIYSRVSFEAVHEYWDRINEVKDTDARVAAALKGDSDEVAENVGPFTLLAHDFIGDSMVMSRNVRSREVVEQEGVVLAQKLDWEYSEVCAETGEAVELVFLQIVRQLRARNALCQKTDAKSDKVYNRNNPMFASRSTLARAKRCIVS
jgi:GTPase SAR1 family protein